MATLGPFADLPDDDRSAVEALATLHRVNAGQLIFRKGDPADLLMIVQSGLVAVQVEAPNDRRLTITLLGEDDVLGEMAIAGVPRRTANVLAMRDTELLAIDSARLTALRSSSPHLDDAVMGVLADTVRRLTNQVLEATMFSQPVRLRRLVLRLHRHYDGGRIELTHEQLAEMLGSQRTTVTGLLTTENAEGRIETGRGYIAIADETALREASQLTMSGSRHTARIPDGTFAAMGDLEVMGLIGGQRLVARRSFVAGETICGVGWGPTSPEPTRWTLQLGDELHAEPLPEELRYANHSCAPNIVFDLQQDVVRAVQDIPVGAQLCFFYPSTEWSMVEHFVCNCAGPECVGVVRGAHALPPAVLARYELSPVIDDLLGDPSLRVAAN
jgi:CRP-like cAMP-binding protein